MVQKRVAIAGSYLTLPLASPLAPQSKAVNAL